MPLLNQSDLFTSAEMTDAINKLPLTAYRFTGMFEQAGVRTTKVDIEILNGRLTWINDSPRGSEPEYLGHRQPSRKIKTLSTTHLAQMDTMAPEDIQDVRAFGTTELVNAATVVNDKMTILKRNLDMTLEYHRLGAVKGIVMDPDGRVLHDIYDTFEVKKQQQQITFPGSDPKNRNPIMDGILAAKRKVENAMGGNPFGRLEAIVGSDFYDMLLGNEVVRKAHDTWVAVHAQSFGDNDYRKRGFEYGGVFFYEASEVVGGKTLVEKDKGHLYPIGPGIWKVYNAPADWMETANTIGRPYYARMDERPRSRGYDIEIQANPLTLCLFPEALVELTAKAGS